MNPIVVECAEVTAHWLLTHLRVNGWTVVPIPIEQATFAEPEEGT
jgi:hypothetical protein